MRRILFLFITFSFLCGAGSIARADIILDPSQGDIYSESEVYYENEDFFKGEYVVVGIAVASVAMIAFGVLYHIRKK